jgi:adenosine/AMP kinase
MDGSGPLGAESDEEAAARRSFIRKIGYKRS